MLRNALDPTGCRRVCWHGAHARRMLLTLRDIVSPVNDPFMIHAFGGFHAERHRAAVVAGMGGSYVAG